MATYRCKQSGNFIVLTEPYDIKTMTGHEGYDLVPDVPVEIEPLKRVGRPRGIKNDAQRTTQARVAHR